MQRPHHARAHYFIVIAASLPLLFGTRPSRAEQVNEGPAVAEPPAAGSPTPAEPAAPTPDPAPVPAPAAPATTPSDAASAPSSGGFPSAAPTSAGEAKASPEKTPSVTPAASAAPAAAASAAPSASTPPAEPEPRKKDDSDGLLGPFRIGPLVGVGLPGVLNFGGTLKITRYFGAGINIGIIPTVQISFYGEATLAYQEYDAYGRIYPFGGGFFLGAGVGYMHAQGSLKETLKASDLGIPPSLLPPGLPDSFEYTSRGSVRAMVLTPQIGYLHTFGSGFSIGFDLGAQIPIAPSEISVKTDVSPQEIAQLPTFKQTEQEVYDTLEKVGSTPLPTINFRIGWLL